MHWWSGFQYIGVLLYAVLLFMLSVGLYRLRETIAVRYFPRSEPASFDPLVSCHFSPLL